jgi:arginine-tRNA-protein transferase
MARVLYQGVEEPKPCPYLEGRISQMEHHVMLEVSPEESDALLERGYRHFGPVWFRPLCETCQACVSVRLDVRLFLPNRSQKRAWRAMQNLRPMIRTPGVDAQRLDLFHAWHKEREQTRSWLSETLDEQTYHLQFAFPSTTTRELAYFDDAAQGRLVMVGIYDETPRTISAIYCYHDPAYHHLSLGTGNIMTLVDMARRNGQRHLYLGYQVLDCPSLRYKARFGPQEILLGRPSLSEDPSWVSGDDRVETL